MSRGIFLFLYMVGKATVMDMRKTQKLVFTFSENDIE